MIIDTHCHLSDERLLSEIDAVISRAKRNSVGLIINPTTNWEQMEIAAQISVEHPEVYWLVGIHPEDVESCLFDKEKFLNFLGKEKVLGIGEIGLDFFRDTEKRTSAIQRELFRAQMAVATEKNLPVAIHMREAEAEMIEELKQMEIIPKGQFHCFAGSEGFLNFVLKKGFYVSFAGNVTFKTAQKLRSLLQKVPLDRLLLETDSPYLSPEPVRGTLNEPANVKILAEFIANVKNIDMHSLINQTTKNAKCLYSLDIS